MKNYHIYQGYETIIMSSYMAVCFYFFSGFAFHDWPNHGRDQLRKAKTFSTFSTFKIDFTIKCTALTMNGNDPL